MYPYNSKYSELEYEPESDPDSDNVININSSLIKNKQNSITGKIVRFSEIDKQCRDLKMRIAPIKLLMKDLTYEKKILKEEISSVLIHKVPEPTIFNLPKILTKTPTALKISRTDILAPMTKERFKSRIFSFFTKNPNETFENLSTAEKTNILFDHIYDEDDRERLLKLNIRQVKYND